MLHKYTHIYIYTLICVIRDETNVKKISLHYKYLVEDRVPLYKKKIVESLWFISMHRICHSSSINNDSVV